MACCIYKQGILVEVEEEANPCQHNTIWQQQIDPDTVFITESFVPQEVLFIVYDYL